MLAVAVVAVMLSATIDGQAPPAHTDAGVSAGQNGAVLPSGTRARQTPAARDTTPARGFGTGPGAVDNSALPPPSQKTTEPREVDPAGNPRVQDRSALPEELSDVPLAPPVTPPAELRPKNSGKNSGKSGGGADKVNDIHAPPTRAR